MRRLYLLTFAYLFLTTAAVGQTAPRAPTAGGAGGVNTPQAPAATYAPRGFANQGIGIGDRNLGSANQGIGIGATQLGQANQGIGNAPMDARNQMFVPNVQSNIPQGAAFVVDPGTGQLFLQMPSNFQQPGVQQPTAGVPTRFGFSTQGATQGATRNAYSPLNQPMPNVEQGAFDAPPASLAGRVTLESTFRDIRQGTLSRQPVSNFGLVFDTGISDALRVQSVAAASIAGRAGLRRGDQILTIDGREFATPERALNYLDTRLASGADAEIQLVRDGREIDVVASSRPTRRRATIDAEGRAALGVTFDDRAVSFVHVWRVAPNSPADQAGLRHGDDIVSINGQHMTTYKDVLNYLATRQPGDPVDLVIFRNGRQVQLEATLGSTEEAFTARRPVSRRRI